MIEKLKKIQTRFGYLSGSNPLDTLDKINELVDAVNEIMTWRFETDEEPEPAKNLQELAKDAEKECRFNPVQADREVYNALTRAENVQDKFAEQRKWIGKLCWFWDIQEEYKFVGILGEVADNGTYFQKDGIVSYLNCEPVKPDDNIIYKGNK